MKFLHLTHRFEFADQIEAILERHEINHFVRYSMVQGMDRDGRHYGTKVFPGSMTVCQAQVPDDKVEALARDLRDFREKREAHRHLEALFLNVDTRI